MNFDATVELAQIPDGRLEFELDYAAFNVLDDLDDILTALTE